MIPEIFLSVWSVRMEMPSLLTTSSSLSHWVRTPTACLALPVPSNQLAWLEVGQMEGRDLPKPLPNLPSSYQGNPSGRGEAGKGFGEGRSISDPV